MILSAFKSRQDFIGQVTIKFILIINLYRYVCTQRKHSDKQQRIQCLIDKMYQCQCNIFNIMRLIRLVDRCSDGTENDISADASEQHQMCIMVTKIRLQKYCNMYTSSNARLHTVSSKHIYWW